MERRVYLAITSIAATHRWRDKPAAARSSKPEAGRDEAGQMGAGNVSVDVEDDEEKQMHFAPRLNFCSGSWKVRDILTFATMCMKSNGL
jgi:hypothetical protein